MNGDVKIVLTAVVYVCLVLALAFVTVFTRRPGLHDNLDDER